MDNGLIIPSDSGLIGDKYVPPNKGTSKNSVLDTLHE